MTDIKIEFIHPTDGRIITVDVDDSMTPNEAINELIAANFIPPSDEYSLAIKGGGILEGKSTFDLGGVKDGDTIRIIPATDGGGYKSETKSGKSFTIPGLTAAPNKEFNIEELVKSPDAIHMIVHLYQNLEKENKNLEEKIDHQSLLLEVERSKSNNRLVGTVLLIVSQIIMGIGGNLVASNQKIGILIITAGFAQALGAVYLNFHKNKIMT
jgi:hypothetical protein